VDLHIIHDETWKKASVTIRMATTGLVVEMLDILTPTLIPQ